MEERSVPPFVDLERKPKLSEDRFSRVSGAAGTMVPPGWTGARWVGCEAWVLFLRQNHHSKREMATHPKNPPTVAPAMIALTSDNEDWLEWDGAKLVGKVVVINIVVVTVGVGVGSISVETKAPSGRPIRWGQGHDE